jgi:proton-coupled amino acid transporter
MIANTAVSLSVLFTYPIQIFPVIEILGPEFPRFWSKLMGGPDIGLADDENEHDLTGFEPMPPLPEHDVADHDTDFDNFIDLSNRDDFVNENKQAGVVEQQPQDWLGLRSSYMSNITEVFPQWSGQSCNLILRMLLVVLTFLVAVVVPNVQALISLAGAIAGSSSALLIPPMLELALIEHLEATSNEMSASSSPRPLRSLSAQQPGFMWKLGGHNLSGKHWKKKLRCYILFWLGFIFFLIGTYASFSNIVMIWIGKG